MDTNNPVQGIVDSLNRASIERQMAFLRESQEKLKIGPVAMARRLETPFNTYKAWLYGNNHMPNIVYVTLDCLIQHAPD